MTRRRTSPVVLVLIIVAMLLTSSGHLITLARTGSLTTQEWVLLLGPLMVIGASVWLLLRQRGDQRDVSSR